MVYIKTWPYKKLWHAGVSPYYNINYITVIIITYDLPGINLFRSVASSMLETFTTFSTKL